MSYWNEANIERVQQLYAQHGTMLSTRICSLVVDQIEAELPQDVQLREYSDADVWEKLWPYLGS